MKATDEDPHLNGGVPPKPDPIELFGKAGAPNPVVFDLDEFEADPADVAARSPAAGVISVGRPESQAFFRTNPDFRVNAYLLTLRDGGDGLFLVSNALAREFEHEVKLKELHLLALRFGGFLVCPLSLPTADGRRNLWVDSARETMRAGETQWVRMVSNPDKGQYETIVAKDPSVMPEVAWPALDRAGIMEKAFSSANLIREATHPVLLQLQGLRTV